MKIRAKKDFLWWKQGQIIDSETDINLKDAPINHVEKFITDNLAELVVEEEEGTLPMQDKDEPIKDELDLNNDGKVDKKDRKIARKLLFGRRKRKK